MNARSSRLPLSAAEREADARQGAAAALRRERPTGFATAPPLAATPAAARGEPLPAATRVEMERLFGQDFSSVRIDRGEQAQRAARGFAARAFAAGEQISFGAHAWAPESLEGRALIAHELSHVLQQRARGRTRIDCDGDRSLLGRVQTLQQALTEAKNDAKARKPLVEQALALGAELGAALAAAIKAEPPAGGEPAYDLRQLFRRLGSSLAGVDEGEAAVKLAATTPDTEVQSAIVNGLPSRSGVEGQQKFLRQVAPLAGQAVAAPGAKQDSRQWLKANTPAIGKSLAELDRRGLKGQKRESMALERSEHLLGEYFVKSDKDERPDPLGDPAGLGTDDQTKQIKADCDVYATFGARLLREQGWTTVGYLAIIPNEKKADDPEHDRDGHAVALMSKAAGKGTAYAGISNATIEELGGHGVALDGEDKARELLLALAHKVYSPALVNYDVYYVAAGTGGAYDVRILDPKNNGLKPIKSVRP